MDTNIKHYAKFMGKKVLHEGRELILHAIYQSHLLCLNGTPDPFPVSYEECKVICNDEADFFRHDIPCDIAVIREAGGKYKSAHTTDLMSDEEKEQEIIEVICKCAKVKPIDLYNNHKCRKKELVQARQVHMVIRNLVIKPKEPVANTAKIYGKDHTTFIHAKNKVLNALDGYDIEFREKFREAFELTKSFYPSAKKKLNLDWL